jgi:hypothetical protein
MNTGETCNLARGVFEKGILYSVLIEGRYAVRSRRLVMDGFEEANSKDPLVAVPACGTDFPTIT